MAITDTQRLNMQQAAERQKLQSEQQALRTYENQSRGTKTPSQVDTTSRTYNAAIKNAADRFSREMQRIANIG